MLRKRPSLFRFGAAAFAAIGLLWGLSAQADGPTASDPLKQLRDGNQRWIADQCTNQRSDKARRQDTAANGQHPFAIVLTCSDSRIPVERVFDQGVGDLFVIRVAGNVCGESETASIEYAAGHLHVPLLVVMGHSGCGAVTAAVEKARGHGSIPALLARIRPAVTAARKANSELRDKALVSAAINANVWQSVEDLLGRSEEIRGLVREGRLKVVGGVYDIDSGKVDWLGTHPDLESLLDAGHGANGSHATSDHAPPAGGTSDAHGTQKEPPAAAHGRGGGH